MNLVRSDHRVTSKPWRKRHCYCNRGDLLSYHQRVSLPIGKYV